MRGHPVWEWSSSITSICASGKGGIRLFEKSCAHGQDGSGSSHMMPERSWVEVRPDEIILRVRVQPRAAKRGVAGVVDGRLKILVTQAPADGRANAAVIRLVAELAAVPKSSVVVSQGGTAREKTLRLSTTDPQATTARLLAALGDFQTNRR